MALTDTEKTQIRFYLGQGSLFRYLNPRLEGIWTSLDSDAETIIRSTLARIVVVDTQLFGDGVSPGTAGASAGIKAVEEIQFSGSSGQSVTVALKHLGRTLVGRLSALIGVPIYADVFSGEGWPGDHYSALGGVFGPGSGGNTF